MGKPIKSWSVTTTRSDRSTELLWIAGALIVAVLLVYLQTASFSFTRYDDNYFVTDNPVVQQGLSLQNLLWSFTTVQDGTWQPITWLSHMLDCQLFGLNAAGHHLANVAYHLIGSLLLFRLLYRLTRTLYSSAMVAALFALHPLHVESVAWVSERRDVLSTVWWILTMSTYAAWVEKRGTARYLLMIACFAVGLMSKPMLVSLPLVLLLLDIWPLKRISVLGSDGYRAIKKTFLALLIEKIPLLIMAVAMSFMAMIAEGKQGTLGTISQYPLLFRIENALVSYVKYLLLTIWPVGLIPHYPYPADYPMWEVVVAAVVLLVISIYCLRHLADRPYLGVGWFWFLVVMFPVIGLVQQGSGFAMADRYTYVPLIGVFIMLVFGVAEAARKFSWPRLVLFTVSGLLLTVCGVLSFIQTSYWRDTQTLFSYTLVESPGNHVALQQLGVEYREKGELDKAYAVLAEDVRLNPENVDALANFGQLLDRMGRIEEAIAYHRKAIILAPDHSELHLNLGQLLARKGDLLGARASSIRALELQPDSIPARFNLGYVYYLEKNYDLAAEQFSQVLRVEPQSSDAYNGLGLVAMARGRLDEATDNFNSALRLNPALQPARNNLQEIQKRRGQS